jgi:hypothetical protein
MSEAIKAFAEYGIGNANVISISTAVSTAQR